MPFGSAAERRSRTTYRPTVTPEESTHVETFTGTTSSFSRTAAAKVAGPGAVRQTISRAHAAAKILGAGSQLGRVLPKRSLHGVRADSSCTARLIFDVPRVRSSNRIGTSRMASPRLTVR